MRVIVIIAAVVLLAAGCSNQDSPLPAAPTQSSTATAAPAPSTSSTPTAEEKPGLSAAEVVAAFQAAKLPVRRPRNNSANCETMQLGCLELITTDDVSVTTWSDSVAMETFAQAYGKEAFVSGNVVLSYAAARTPASLRPKYQQVLTGMR